MPAKARAKSLEATLVRLAEMRREPVGDGSAAELERILGGKLAQAVAVGAEIAQDRGHAELAPALVAAFDRFMESPAKRDPGCRAKTAIADALQLLDAGDADVFLRGIRHVQREPVFGGSQDTAPALRGACARGLVRMNHPDAMLLLADLLADPETPARVAAARAIAYHGGEIGVPLLRLKVLTGDPELDVTGDCMLALLALAPESSVPFVAGFLDDPAPAVAETAALALGESRAPGALEALRAYWERTIAPDRARPALVGIAMLRNDEALAYLFSLMAREPGPTARQAVSAFELYRDDAAIERRVREAARAREDVDLADAVAAVFD